LLAISCQAIAEPKHIELARELLVTVKPENNKYIAYGPQGVRWKGDFFTSENVVNTQCVGLISAVLDRAKCPTVDIIKSKTSWRGTLLIDNYFEAINKGYGLTKIESLFDAKAGDIFMFRCRDACRNNEGVIDGHIAFVDEKPVQRAATRPIIENTLQWTLTVIDSSDTAHNITDTRYETKQTGIGRGIYRVYTDLEGKPVGYTTGYAFKYFPDEVRNLLFARPQSASSSSSSLNR